MDYGVLKGLGEEEFSEMTKPTTKWVMWSYIVSELTLGLPDYHCMSNTCT